MMPDPRPPERVGTIPDRAIATAEMVTLEVSPYFRDPDGGSLTYGAASSAAGVVSVMQSGGVLTIVGVGEGTATVTVTATDAGGLTVSQSFQVTVETPNRPPEAADTIPPQRLIVGPPTVLQLSSYFRDPDGDALSYGVVSSRDRVVVASTSEGRLILVGFMPGTATATVTAADPAGLTATQTVRITVEAPNQAPLPQGTIAARRVAVGDTTHLDVATYFRDPDGDTLSYRAASSEEAVASVTIIGNTLTLAGVGAGTAVVTVTATDPGHLTATQTAEVTVVDVNAAPQPVGTIPAQSLSAGDAAMLDVLPYFRDPDGDDLSYRAVSSDEDVASAAIAGDTLTLAGFRSGTASVTVTAADPDGLTATQTAVVTVTAGPGGFRDDFDSDASLENWRLESATATVREGVLYLRTHPLAPVGVAVRPLPLPLSSWTIRASMGRETRAEVAVAWLTGHSRFQAFRFEIGTVARAFDYILAVYDAEQRQWLVVRAFSGNSDAIRDDPGELTDVTVEFTDGTLVMAAGETELHRSAITNETLKSALTNVTGEVWVSVSIANLGFFDYVEVSGIQGAAADAATHRPESIRSLRELLTNSRWMPLDPAKPQ